MTSYQHRLKTAFEWFCAAVREGATPDELFSNMEPRANKVGAPPSFDDMNAAIRGQRQPTAPPPQPVRAAEIGDAPPPPSFSAGLNAAFTKGTVR